VKINRKAKIFGAVVVVCLAASVARSDSLECRNGSLIKGKFIGGTNTEISFQVGSSVQKYQVADIASLKFDFEAGASDRPRSDESAITDHVGNTPEFVTVPAGTRISVRTIDGIDSSKNHVGDRFQASLEEALIVDGNVVAPKGTDVYGRLEESKTSGTFTGRSELRLELTGIVVNGLSVPVLTGDYELSGKSRGASTAKRTVGGAAAKVRQSVLASVQAPALVRKSSRRETR